MTNAPQPLQTGTTSAAPVAEPASRGPRSNGSHTAAVCNLTEAKAFCEGYFNPHVPVLAAFGGDRLHVCRLHGSWDLVAMVADHADSLYRSIHLLPPQGSKEKLKEWDDLTFHFGPKTFLYADKTRIVAFAASAEEAERLVVRFSAKYGNPKRPHAMGGTFHLIQQGSDNIRTKEVSLSPETILKPEALKLHYGSVGAEWHQGYVEKLRKQPSGLTILEGKPGTGKTFYLRHLIGELKETHRFVNGG